MKKWIQKAIVQKTISFLPYKNKFNYFFQKYVTKGVFLTDEYFEYRIDHAHDHLKGYMKCNNGKIPESTLEIGTGWYPVVPVCFFLAGCKNIHTVDISFLTSKKRIETTLNKILDYHNKGKLQKYVDYKIEKIKEIEEILSNLENLQLKDILKKLNLIYLLEDARKLSLPDNSIDLINSNNTFEHIYPEILTGILSEFKRVVKKTDLGVMSHFIDMSDHFAHFDKTITIYNFLRYSDKKWKRIDNSIQPQNRLRINDYKEIYKQLSIPITEESFRKPDLLKYLDNEGNCLDTLPLDKKYFDSDKETLLISHCYFVSKM